MLKLNFLGRFVKRTPFVFQEPQVEINFDPDRPIQEPQQDRLGFDQIADNLSKSVLSSTAREGLVIGIEGKWGSGKSSILNLLCNKIEKYPSNATVVRFDPWILGDKKGMATSLIATLAMKVLYVGRSRKVTFKSDIKIAKILSKKLMRYAVIGGRGLSPLLKLASICGLHHTLLLSKGVDIALRSMTKGDNNPPSLDILKADLIDGLRDFDHRFIVVIDDLDRLEPAEAAEIMRLVKAVGNFPNIVYLLSYDYNVLAHSLESALKVKNGKAFLQKIIQINFSVPVPEEFDLRRWFQKECLNLHSQLNGEDLSPSVIERLNNVCDSQGQLLQTPRDIAQILNALKLVYPSIVGKVDFADLCWLQILRIKNYELYKWVEQYLTIFAAILIGGAGLTKVEKIKFARKLRKLIPNSEISLSPNSIWYFGKFIPGIVESNINTTSSSVSVFSDLSEQELAEVENNMRLGSPHHYRLYFAFAQPAGALPDGIIAKIIQEATIGEDVTSDIAKLIQRDRPQGGTLYELFLFRLSRIEEEISLEAWSKIMNAIGDTVDEAQLKEREGTFSTQRMVWSTARALFVRNLKKLGEDRAAYLEDMFTNRKSIGWLLAEVIGGETFAHARAGNSSLRQEEPILTSEEYDKARNIIFVRLEGPEREKIFNVPNFLAFCLRWHQAGGTQGLKAWIDTYAITDENFLNLLLKLRSWRSSNDVVSYPLYKSQLNLFMDFEEAFKRLKVLEGDKSKPENLRKIATSLIAATVLAE